MFPINLSLKWLIPLLVFTLGLIAVCSLWVLREWGEPEWKRYQEAGYAEMQKDLQEQLKILEDPTWGDPKKAQTVRRSLEYLREPALQVKQTILKGYGHWKEGSNGLRIDRCTSCHINEDKLIKQHPYTAESFPFDIYGCTVCHGGNGRALKTRVAHEGMYSKKGDMEDKRLKNPEKIIALWKSLAELSLQEGLMVSDFKYYNVTGEKQIYVGSTGCIKCHKKLTSFHLDQWADNKFKTFEKVKLAKDYVEGDDNYRKQCLKCHTTGYDEKTGEYSEENVTCEACHGPGEIYARFMTIGKIAEAATLTKATFDFKVCGNCHIPRAHEMRQAMLLALEAKEMSSLAEGLREVSGELYALISEEGRQETCSERSESKGILPPVDSPRSLVLSGSGVSLQATSLSLCVNSGEATPEAEFTISSPLTGEGRVGVNSPPPTPSHQGRGELADSISAKKDRQDSPLANNSVHSEIATSTSRWTRNDLPKAGEASLPKGSLQVSKGEAELETAEKKEKESSPLKAKLKAFKSLGIERAELIETHTSNLQKGG